MRFPDHAETLFSIATDPEMPATTVQVYHKMPPEEDWSIGGYRQRIVERLYNSILTNRFAEIAREPNPPFLRASSAQGQLIRSKGTFFLSAAVLETVSNGDWKLCLLKRNASLDSGFTESELERQKVSVMRGMERSYTNRANRNSERSPGNIPAPS